MVSFYTVKDAQIRQYDMGTHYPLLFVFPK